MTVAITDQIAIGDTVLFKWTPETGTFKVYLDGQKPPAAVLVNIPQYVLTLAPGEQVQVEIRDDNADPSPAYPSRAYLNWYAPAGNPPQYRIDKLVSGVWTQRRLLQAPVTQTYFEYQTEPLADCTVHYYRIVPIGADGNEGQALYETILMVRNPDPPTVTSSYDPSTRTVMDILS